MIRKIRLIIIFLGAAALALAVFFWAKEYTGRLGTEYNKRASVAILDRDKQPLFIKTNYLGYFSDYSASLPQNVKNALISKEDRFFYWHLGINPVSVIKDLARRVGIGNRAGSSTITQQAAKIMLGQENNRSVANKISETLAAFALEITQKKETILTEYSNLVYFGNRLQGFRAASLAYFGVTPDALSQAQIYQLLATISDPSGSNPATESNIGAAKALAKNLSVDPGNGFTSPQEVKKNLVEFSKSNTALFELRDYLANDSCQNGQITSLDRDVNGKLRAIMAQNLEQLNVKKAKNAAAIVIGLPSNQILAMSGSPDPGSLSQGYQINMLAQPRQIGSTIKPFIYLKAFEKGARPYTIIDDREYKYPAGEDFSFYPENYDRTYRGKITAHYALANSINVAAAKALEFDGINDFSKFVNEDLAIKTQQDVSTYQMGIAMGTMETDIVSLARAFTIFPNAGKLQNLKLFENDSCNNEVFDRISRPVANDIYIQLINKILSDRVIAQDQFGAKSVLTLPADNYALKTGTSHDFTDSWVIGYTPDFLVAVWVGNADASAMEGVSGQVGAGKIWADIMEMMLATNYDKKTPFDFSNVVEYKNDSTVQYGLENDDYEKSKNIIETRDTQLILKPHNNDIYEWSNDARIVLQAKEPVTWSVNGQKIGSGQEVVYSPPNPDEYEISAAANDRSEKISITFQKR